MSVVNQCDIRPKARKPMYVIICVPVHWLVGAALDCCFVFPVPEMAVS